MSSKTKRHAVFARHEREDEHIFDEARMLRRRRGGPGWSHVPENPFATGAHQVPVQLLLQASIGRTQAGEVPDARIDEAVRVALTERLIWLSNSGVVLNGLAQAVRLVFSGNSLPSSPRLYASDNAASIIARDGLAEVLATATRLVRETFGEKAQVVPRLESAGESGETVLVFGVKVPAELRGRRHDFIQKYVKATTIPDAAPVPVIQWEYALPA